MVLSPKECQLLAVLRREGPLSRWELHEKTGLRPNTVGTVAARMLEEGLVREGDAETTGPGRPRVPLEIDPGRRRVLGLAIEPGRVSACQLNLCGERLGDPIVRTMDNPDQMAGLGRELLGQFNPRGAVAIGISATGFVDPERRSILMSATMRGHEAVSLDPIYQAAGDCPVLLENDMHALAANWMLTHDPRMDEDVLLVSIRDGAIGAAVLVDGRPNRGCVVGGNELGHNRFFVETEDCFCGHRGCLERICSTPFLHRHGGADEPLDQRLASFTGSDPGVELILRYLALGLSNAVNFIRPNRLVLVSGLTRHTVFAQALIRQIRGALLGTLADRVRIDLWDEPGAGFAETAGWLALASIYREGWGPLSPLKV